MIGSKKMIRLAALTAIAVGLAEIGLAGESRARPPAPAARAGKTTTNRPAAARSTRTAGTAPRASTSTPGSIRYAQPRTSTTTTRQLPSTSRGSIRYSQPSGVTPGQAAARQGSSLSRSGTINVQPRSTFGSSGGSTRSQALGRSGTSFHTPGGGFGRGRSDDHRGTSQFLRGGSSRGRPYGYGYGGRSVWARPPYRAGYRPRIAPPFRSLGRSYWRTILSPYYVAPIGSGLGLVGPSYGHSRFYYGPDGGRISYYRPPTWGTVYPALPSGAVSISFGGRSLYAWGGVYYSPFESGYRVVRPPVGALVSYLPPDYSYVDVEGQRYYYNDNVYYTYVPDESIDIPEFQNEYAGEGVYAVVDPPLGAEVNELPPGAELEEEDGQVYYQLGDAWYLPIYREGTLSYLRVPDPD